MEVGSIVPFFEMGVDRPEPLHRPGVPGGEPMKRRIEPMVAFRFHPAQPVERGQGSHPMMHRGYTLAFHWRLRLSAAKGVIP
jgi:hypothetical protein